MRFPSLLPILLLSVVTSACASPEDPQSKSDPTQPLVPVAPSQPTDSGTPSLNLSRLTNEVLRIPYDNTARGQQINLYGRITAPEGYRGHKLPLVIIAPGFGNNLEFIADRYAPTIARLGFVTYAFDFYGGNHGSRSGGTMLEMSPFTEVDDMTAVLKYLREQPYVDADRIFLLGFSQGGVVSAITAASYPDQVRGLVLMNAALVLFDDAREFRDRVGISEVNNYKGQRLGRIYFERSLDYDIYSILPRFTRETLVVQGDRDDIVPLRYAQRAAEVLPNAQLELISGGGHIFSAAQDRRISEELLTNYFRRFLR